MRVRILNLLEFVEFEEEESRVHRRRYLHG
jgi:hypothetical protein